MEKIRLVRIDVVATTPDSNELQWLDVTSRRPSALTNMEWIGKNGRTLQHKGEREKTKKYGNRIEVGPDTVNPISLELGGRLGPQTVSVLQSVTAKLAEARGGELNAAAALRKLRLVIERTLIRAEADALNATTAHEEQANVRRMLRGNEHEGDVEDAGRTAPQWSLLS